jgi:hypothetical protein
MIWLDLISLLFSVTYIVVAVCVTVWAIRAVRKLNKGRR